MSFQDVPGLVDDETYQELFNMIADKAKSGMRFAEIGVLIGSSICCLGTKLKAQHKDVELNAIDLWEGTTLSEASHEWLNVPDRNHEKAFFANIRRYGLDRMVKIHKGDSIKVSQSFADKSLDFLFVDGDHGGSYIEREFRSWYPKLKSNSIVAFHDYADIKCHIQPILTELKLGTAKETSNGATGWVEIGGGLA